MARASTLIPALLALCVTAAAGAGEIYRWTDEHGKVHFGDRPPPSAEAIPQEIDIPDGPPSGTAAASDAARRARQQRLLESYARDRAEKKQAAAQEKERRAELALKCARAKHKLEQIRQAGYLYDLDAQGERVIHSDEQRAEATRRLEQNIASNCK